METHVLLTSDPIVPAPPPVGLGAGAWTEFHGLVRGEEDGGLIDALEYEAYPGMAEREIHRLLAELGREHVCLLVAVCHRVGRIPVGEAAIHVGIASRHRAEGFAFLAAFMDRLKQDVPIWKRRAIPAGSSEP